MTGCTCAPCRQRSRGSKLGIGAHRGTACPAPCREKSEGQLQMVDYSGTVQGIPMTRTYRGLGFSKQALHFWRANPISQRDWDDAHLANAAIDVHGDDPACAYRLIRDELTLTQGRVMCTRSRTPAPIGSRACPWGRARHRTLPQGAALRHRRPIADRHHRALRQWRQVPFPRPRYHPAQRGPARVHGTSRLRIDIAAMESFSAPLQGTS